MVRGLCALLLFVSLPALAADVSEHLQACNEKYADCKEDCSMSYGSKVKYRQKLGKCLNRCRKTETRCKSSITELEQAGIDHESFANKPKDPVLEEKAAVDEKPAPEKTQEPEQVAASPKPEEKVSKKVEPPPPPPKKKIVDDDAPPPAKKAQPLDEWEDGVVEH